MSAPTSRRGLFSGPTVEQIAGPGAAQMARANELIDQNLGLNFVQRALEENRWPSLPSPDGGYMTHLMAWGGEDDPRGPVVFPTIVWDGKQLRQLPMGDAWRHANLTGEMLRVRDPAEAEWFSHYGYKQGSGLGMAPRGSGGLAK